MQAAVAQQLEEEVLVAMRRFFSATQRGASRSARDPPRDALAAVPSSRAPACSAAQ
jgi:hypothetical protein